MTKSFYRIVAAGLTVLAVAGCDARRIASTSSEDQQVPFIDVSVPGDTTRQFDIGQPLTVNVKASDNLSLLRVEVDVVRCASATTPCNGGVGGSLIAVDTIQFSTQTQTYTNSFQVPLAGVAAGTKIGIYGVVIDGAGNTNRDSMFVTTADTSAPIVALTSPAVDQIFKTDSTIKVGLSVQDNAGITMIGFDILRGTDSTVFDSDTVRYTVTPTSKDTVIRFVVPASMPPGEYHIRGFAVDASGNRGESALRHITVRDIVPPTIQFLAPAPDQKFGLQDSILVTVRIQDASGLQRLTLVGISTRGDPAFGIVDTVIRYDSTFAPINVSGQARSFPPGTTDVTVSRYLKPKNPNDTITEPVLIVATVTDVSNNTTTAIRRVQLVSGPRVVIIRPAPGSLSAAGQRVYVELRATDIDGVALLGFDVLELSDSTNRKTFSGTITDTTWTFQYFIPASYPANSRLTFVPRALDRGGQPGSGTPVSITVSAPPADTRGPLVYQTYGAKFEIDDTLTVRAIDANGVNLIGYFIKDSTGTTRDSATRTLDGLSGDETVRFRVNVPSTLQGRQIYVTSFARDTRGNFGYSLPAGDTISRTAATAKRDTLNVTYGRTFQLPGGGTGADIAVDTLRGRTYISNTVIDRIQVFRNDIQAFDPQRIAVGADPWGMFIDADTLLVANSAGTNISRVEIGGATVPATERTDRRIKTPLSIITEVLTAIDEAGRRRFTLKDYQFSDRPQYLAQMRRNGARGDIYYSTKPTPSAPAGTIRRYDPAAGESQQIWQYGTRNPSPKGAIVIFNADSTNLFIATDSTKPDLLEICDHPYGNFLVSNCVRGTDVREIIEGPNTANGGVFLKAIGSDVVAVSELDVASLGLTDTTFVAAGGDRRWIAFGEAQLNVGRVMLAKDTMVFNTVSGDSAVMFSPSMFVRDLTNNASDRIFGIAINKNSTSVGVHGIESFFSEIEQPYLLRLQGKVNTFDVGAGIAFHPEFAGSATVFADPVRKVEQTAFVASSNGTIEIVDAFHYTSRGVLPVRANLYGPIRAVRVSATDPANALVTNPNDLVVVRLFGLTTEGFIVIDVKNSDIKSL